jgi:tryptophan synthase alpha chain
MSRIAKTFAQLKSKSRKALIPFVTAGDPHPDQTVAIMHALARSGADIIELGVPFSDPMADGPVIQRSSERALAHGTSLRRVMKMVSEFRQTDDTTPVVLMGYANPIEAMGHAVFAASAQAAGVDGVLVVDYPPEESGEFVAELRKNHIDAIFLLSPTSVDARIDEVGRLATGYIYYVSLKGVTGAATLDLNDVAARIPNIRKRIDLPVGVGFGIRDAATARSVAGISDAVVIGSRLVQEIEKSKPDALVSNVAALVSEFRRTMDAA